jgi:hypothetical protein
LHRRRSTSRRRHRRDKLRNRRHIPRWRARVVGRRRDILHEWPAQLRTPRAHCHRCCCRSKRAPPADRGSARPHFRRRRGAPPCLPEAVAFSRTSVA